MFRYVLAGALRFLLLLGLCSIAEFSTAARGTYDQSLAVLDGKPTLQLTNSSDQPITAFMMVEFPSVGMEGRTYYDFYLNSHERPILPGASITKDLSFFKGSDPNKIRAEVKAVIFKDGSSAGDPIWVDVILARRVRLYDRLLSLRELLSRQVGTGISREGSAALLQAAQADADRQLPDDDLRVVDDLAFQSAISTITGNTQASVDLVLARHMDYLEQRASKLEGSLPSLDAIRAKPMAVPKPVSDLRDPKDILGDKSLSNEVRPQTASVAAPAVSWCTLSTGSAHQIDSKPCLDSDGDSVTVDNEYQPTATFIQYNATTNKKTTIPWTSPYSYWADGVCASYTDCDADNDVYYIEGTAHCEGADCILSNNTVDQGEPALRFYWTFDLWDYPTYSTCDQCDICPSCVYNPTSNDQAFPSTLWYFSYQCSITG